MTKDQRHHLANMISWYVNACIFLNLAIVLAWWVGIIAVGFILAGSYHQTKFIGEDVP